MVRLARSTYAGFNDHHLCEKLCEVEGFSLSRETTPLLSCARPVSGSPRKRRAPAHRQRRLRSARDGELVQLDGSPARLARRPRPAPHRSRHARRRHRQNPGRAVLPLRKRASAISPCSANCCAATALPSPFTAIIAASSYATTTSGRWKNSSPANVSPPSSAALSSNLASPQAKGLVERLWGVLQDRLTSELRLAQACDLDSANAVLRRFQADYNRRFARPPRDANRLASGPGKSAPHLLLRSSARGQQRQHRAVGGPAFPDPAASNNASALPEPRFTSMKLSTGAFRFITVIPACNTPWLRQGDIFMLPLG